MLRMLQAALGRDERVSVVIGSENTVEGMEACSLVTSAYLAGDASGSIGVLGPTRMDYLRAMAAVQAVARYPATPSRDTDNWVSDYYQLLEVDRAPGPRRSSAPTGGWPASTTRT